MTGRGGVLTNLEGRSPLVRDRDVVALGFRHYDEYAAEVRQAGIKSFASHDIVREGPNAIGQRAADSLEARGVSGYWIHLDIDVLDGDLMPAVDSPEPDGLTYPALTELLGPLLLSPRAMGMDITVFDPDLDADQTLSRNVVEAIVAAFGSTARKR